MRQDQCLADLSPGSGGNHSSYVGLTLCIGLKSSSVGLASSWYGLRLDTLQVGGVKKMMMWWWMMIQDQVYLVCWAARCGDCSYSWERGR